MAARPSVSTCALVGPRVLPGVANARLVRGRHARAPTSDLTQVPLAAMAHLGSGRARSPRGDTYAHCARAAARSASTRRAAHCRRARRPRTSHGRSSGNARRGTRHTRRATRIHDIPRSSRGARARGARHLIALRRTRRPARTTPRRQRAKRQTQNRRRKKPGRNHAPSVHSRTRSACSISIPIAEHCRENQAII